MTSPQTAKCRTEVIAARLQTCGWLRVFRRTAGAMALLTALVGCEPASLNVELDDYLTRLTRPLDLSKPRALTPSAPMPPRAGALRLQLQSGSLDGLDFMRLSGCALQTTIARRNSSLGRMAPPSQRLLLELAYLREAPDCIATLKEDGKNDLAALLLENQALKKKQLPALIFNATLASEEYRDFWRPPGAIGSYPGNTSSLVVTALEHISGAAERWLAGDYRADETALELALADIARGDGGELLLALRTQDAYLGSASGLLSQRASERPLCQQDIRPAAADVLKNVASKYFAGRVQARAAQLNQRFHALLPPIEALEFMLEDTLPTAYRAWRGQRSMLLEQAVGAPSEHVRALQALLGSCFAEFAPEPAPAAPINSSAFD